MICGPVAGLALGLTTAASAQGHAHVEHGQVAPIPAAPSLPPAPDMRPAWQGAAPAPMQTSAMMPDDRTRQAWLNECHRRTAMYYGGHRKRGHHHDDARREDRGPSYCEAYFEDYYRNYRGYAQGYAYAVPVAPPMMMHTQMAQPRAPECREIETVTYEPIRTRVIPRRAAPRRVVPDKRIRIAPDKRQRMD